MRSWQQVAADMLGLPIDNRNPTRRPDTAAITGRRRIMDRSLGIEQDRDDSERRPSGVAAFGKANGEFAACRRNT